ncbi:MAG: recombinase family protein, partial [Bacilli bacterium]
MSLYEIRKLINTGVSINNIKLRVTFYARVSTSKDEQLNSLSNQISYFVDYIKKNSNWEYIEGYIDEGVSATKINNRNNFIRMINDAKNDKFDLILTKEVSRFSRDTIDSLEYTRKLLEYDTAVYFLSDNINTINSDSELRLTLMSSLAQDEVRKLSERTKFGLRRAVLSGKVLGNNNIYGYKKNNGTLIIDVESKHLIENIFTLYVKENISLRALSDKLFNMGFKSNNDTPLHPNTIKRIIMNPKYKGNFTGLITEKVNYRSNKRRKNNDNMINYECSSIPKIISKELWNKANKKMIERGSNRALSQKGNKYLFSSKLICSKHNCGYVHRYTQKNKNCYFCKNYNDTGRRSCEHSILIEKDLKNVLNSYFNTLNIKNIKSSLINRYM